MLENSKRSGLRSQYHIIIILLS
ncbi:hypothetical protein NC651_012059 [Populus alba x Populus x berolinensis]|nr:hypothetical protein NC651_012059 [Populus alba x Populus x berolinensis]